MALTMLDKAAESSNKSAWPAERIGFHRHVLDYFWTCVSGGRGRQHVHDGSTVEYSYAPLPLPREVRRQKAA
jgi:hypothetical protein